MESVIVKDQENVKQRLGGNDLHNMTLLKLSIRDLSNVTLILPLTGNQTTNNDKTKLLKTLIRTSFFKVFSYAL
jgi:hypothetical protein